MIAILLGYGARFLMAWPGCSNSSSSELEPQTHGQIASGPTPRRANTNEAQSEVPRDRKATARETGRVQMSPSPPLPCHGSSLSLALSPPESILPPASSPSTSALPACTTPSTRLTSVRKEGKRGEGGWLEAGRRLQRSLVGHAYNWTEKKRDLLVEDPQPGVRCCCYIVLPPVVTHEPAGGPPSVRSAAVAATAAVASCWLAILTLHAARRAKRRSGC